MMDAQLRRKYEKLSPEGKHLVQLAAVYYETLNRTDLVRLSNKVGWKTDDGNSLAYKAVREELKRMIDQNLLELENGSRLTVHPKLVDFAAQEAIRAGDFEQLANGIARLRQKYRSYTSYHGRELSRSDASTLRIAFYQSDLESLKENQPPRIDLRLIGPNSTSLGVLSPFDQQIFSGLAHELQERYLIEATTWTLASGSGSQEALDVAVEFTQSSQKTPQRLVACATDILMARGDLAGLAQLDKHTKGRYAEIQGCRDVLSGDYAGATEAFEAAVKRIRRTSRKRNVAIEYLPGLLHLSLMLRDNSPESRKAAISAMRCIDESWEEGFRQVSALFSEGFTYQKSPGDRAKLFTYSVGNFAPPLCILFAGYLRSWLKPEDETSVTAPTMKAAIHPFKSLGLTWLQAEMESLLGRMKTDDAKQYAKTARDRHAELGTRSLLDLIEPATAWQRSLTALAQIGEDRSPDKPTDLAAQTERLIWEISYDKTGSYFSLRPLIQKTNKSGAWTKGRPVAMERLYHHRNDTDQFGFLTKQDKQLAGCIEQHTTQSYRHYEETLYLLDNDRAAAFLAGHPLLFREGDRTQPIEVVRRDPQLMVTKTKAGNIKINLSPSPESSSFRLSQEAPNRLGLTCFSPEHCQIHEIIGKGVTVPKAGEAEVLAAVRAIAKVVTIQSAVGDGETVESSDTVKADPRPHVHLLPYMDGLRVEFFTRPFGNTGPFYRPGEGGENVFGEVDGKNVSAKRRFSEEIEQARRIVESCQPLAGMTAEGVHEYCFPTSIEALELMLALQPSLESGEVQAHWPQGKRLHRVEQVEGSQLRLHIRRDRDWFAASGKLHVDDKLTLDMMELVKLVEATPSRFIRLDDDRYLALTDEFRRRIEDLATVGRKQKTKIRFAPIHAAALEDLEGTFKVRTDETWKQHIRKLREASELTPEIPSTFQGELRDYQRDGFVWICRLAHWGVGACLADDMGLGKTIQAIAVLLQRAEEGPALVVAPTSVSYNWQRELQRFSPTLTPQVFGPGDRAAFFEDLGPRDVVVTSYGLLHNEAKRFHGQHWQTAILDEAQAIKNMATKRSKAAMGLEADFRLIMTGTPLENHLGELWNLSEFINPGLLGPWEDFQRRFAVPIEGEGSRGARRQLKRLIQPFILRRTKTQVLDELPPRTEVTLEVELSRAETAFYEALRRRAIEKLEELEDSKPQNLAILAEIMRLRRACCHPRLVDEQTELASSKLALFCETVDELLENRHKALVFSQFVDHLTILREQLDRKQIRYQYLDGSTPAKERQKRVDAFQAGDGDVFLISLKAGGLGLNLTAADYVIHMDLWWNPAVEDQASDRAHRLGQQRPVTIYRFVTKGTIEEQILELHASKRDLADSLLEGSDVTGKLSMEELLKLIRR